MHSHLILSEGGFRGPLKVAFTEILAFQGFRCGIQELAKIFIRDYPIEFFIFHS